jgi:hypothetical protein
MRKAPDDPLEFIRRCIGEQKLYWTYHVNMRLAGRYITRDDILSTVNSYEIVESYPEDKYLSSYLILAGSRFHVLFATDIEGDNVRVITTYVPDPDEWNADLKTRRSEK